MGSTISKICVLSTGYTPLLLLATGCGGLDLKRRKWLH